MSTYLLFLGLGDFERREIDVDGTKLGVVTKHGALDKARFALESAAGLLRYYNDYFGIPYALPKLDLFAAPGVGEFGFHAMENWGAILYFESVMLVDPRLSTESDRQRIFTYVAHEMAHQWFGNLVTMAWWDDLWLNEAFAEWMENKATDHFHPLWRIWLQTEDVRQLAMRQDSMASTHAIVQRIQTPNQIAFDNITYDKGQWVIRMLEGYIGAESFRRGVRSYMRKFAFGNATTEDLLTELESAAGKPIKKIANDFTQQPGVPLVMARAEGCNGGESSLAITQKRFALDNGSRRPTEWLIPVSAVAAGASGKVTVLMRGAGDTKLSLPDCRPIKVNAAQIGYFRSGYSPDAFERLSAEFAVLNPEDQLGLLYDSWALAEADLAPVAYFFGLTRRLARDDEPAVWRGAVRILGNIDSLYAGTPGQTAFRRYARARLAPLWATVGWNAQPGEPDNVAVLREDLVTFLGQIEDAEVIAEARRRFDLFLQDPARLPAAVLRPTLQVVGQNADETTYQTLLRLATEARDPAARQMIYEALAGARKGELAQRSLDLTLGAEIPAAAGLAMIKRVAADHADLAWHFALAHRDALNDKFTSQQRFEFVPSLATRSNDRAHLAELRDFINRFIPADARQPAEKAYSELAFRLVVRDRCLPKINEWLDKPAE